ncbi:potassium channel family protein [Denitromonas iodatirespirans]|uniref:NAD-binding protein n=1 Tax=Denitromonas iodatirespirans TaxID=2795389 RepID=A0A944D6P0_DENI1|nr:potassium channel protein [Denitromonas iodatirespirans]MBT0960830.1 NAD-binding protein [Denitromonas iodatirespirans]
MTPAGHQSTLFLALRRLRAPLLTLIVIFSVSVLGLTLVPGIDGERMSFFHAFYFISYTATTIGFGEVPEVFSEQQRLWVTICIYMAVVGWAYTIGSVFALLQNQTFRNAVDTAHFARQVRRIHEPFYLVCGYGETGRLVCKALDRLGERAVVVEHDPVKASEQELHGYVTDIPCLTADARLPETLRFAGLTNRNCRGVLALTDDDNANLAIAISARLLAPKLPAMCRASSADVAANMASFGTRHIINPFAKFAEYLALALHAPNTYHLLTWLTGLPGTAVERHRDPPLGKWVLCGYGGFGKILVEAFDQEGVPVIIIDREAPDGHGHRVVRGDATGAATLERANIQQAVGIVASTGNDIDNLSIAVTARELNPDLFVILRMNAYANHALFDAFDSDVTVVPSEIIGNECLAVLTTPLLEPFLQEIATRDDAWSAALLDTLTTRFGWNVPSVWSVRLNLQRAPALYRHLMRNSRAVRLGDLMRDPHNRAQELAAAVLYLHRDDDDHVVLPTADALVRPGDRLLLVGQPGSRADFTLTVSNEHTLDYVLTGADRPGGWVWEWLAQRRRRISGIG